MKALIEARGTFSLTTQDTDAGQPLIQRPVRVGGCLYLWTEHWTHTQTYTKGSPKIDLYSVHDGHRSQVNWFKGRGSQKSLQVLPAGHFSDSIARTSAKISGSFDSIRSVRLVPAGSPGARTENAALIRCLL